MADESSMRKNFVVDARTILTLGRDSIKDHTTALPRLVKDAMMPTQQGSRIRSSVTIQSLISELLTMAQIMTESDIDNSLAENDYSSKTVTKLSSETAKDWRKGIGRLSIRSTWSDGEAPHKISQGGYLCC